MQMGITTASLTHTKRPNRRSWIEGKRKEKGGKGEDREPEGTR
jgi:hypothetical protein